jgi:hypothetical protein
MSFSKELESSDEEEVHESVGPRGTVLCHLILPRGALACTARNCSRTSFMRPVDLVKSDDYW